MTYTLEIDDREKRFTCDEVLARFKYISDSVNVKRLSVGDFIFTEENGGVTIIERKHINDFVSSIQDGRYHDQHHRLIEIRDSFKDIDPDLIKIVYLVEEYTVTSDADLDNYISKSHIKYRQILSAMTKLMFRENIHVICARDTDDSVRWLEMMWKNFTNGRFGALDPDVEHSKLIQSKISSARKRNGRDEWWITALTHIPGMSPGKAREIADNYPTIVSLLKAYEKSNKPERLLQDIVHGKRKIGKVLSERVYTYILGTNPKNKRISKPSKRVSNFDKCLIDDSDE